MEGRRVLVSKYVYMEQKRRMVLEENEGEWRKGGRGRGRESRRSS